MKRIYKLSSRIALGIICSIFTLVFFISLVLSAVLTDMDLFSNDKNEFRNNLYNMAGKDYAMWALSERDNNFNADKLDSMNCYYGIIEDYDPDNKDLNDPDSYVYTNFKNVNVPKNAFVSVGYRIGRDAKFNLSKNLLTILDENSYYNNYEERMENYSIDGIGYDLIGQQAYVYANGNLYPLYTSCFEYIEDSTINTGNADNIYKKIWGNSALKENELRASSDAEDETTVENIEGKLLMGGKAYEPLSNSVTNYVLKLNCNDGDVEYLGLENVADLSEIHDSLDPYNNMASLNTLSSMGASLADASIKTYTVVCFPKENFVSTTDFYAQAESIASKAGTLRILLPTACVVSFLIAIASFILFLCAAGHWNGSKEVVAKGTDKLPTDLAFVSTIVIELFILGFVYDNRGFNAVLIVVWTLLYMVAAAVGLIFCSNIAVNFKLKQLLKNTVIIGGLNRIKPSIKKQIKLTCATIKWTTRIWIIFIIFAILEFGGIVLAGSGGLLLPWLIEKIIFAVILHRILYNYAKIKSTTMKLAEGETSAQVDTDGMPEFLLEHAEAVNAVRSGITVAIDERTKSERMKTELITNVSHDIKTPLTSIINYVDLLGKEDIKNENVSKYLKVLDRQSNRLKKLIEDLIEASKASTGNIEFNMEKINAQVLLNQSIGEFSDKLTANKISLFTDIPEHEIYLCADNRYLWRVFDNLMSNIVKYAQSNTRCYVDLKETDDKLQFVFRNTSKKALNISADELMERFVRGDRSRYTEGNGLGLSIARSLTEGMGGNLIIDIDGDLFKATVEFKKS
ncbi:MAG: HAMP domain-containing histidine kinase [Pseudobutyrivibrio sp.]|nr:HAMP domain-containing histidine kinase [Pseudobutyrivibrio sp.]